MCTELYKMTTNISQFHVCSRYSNELFWRIIRMDSVTVFSRAMSPDELVYLGVLASSIPVGFLFRYLSECLKEWIKYIFGRPSYTPNVLLIHHNLCNWKSKNCSRMSLIELIYGNGTSPSQNDSFSEHSKNDLVWKRKKSSFASLLQDSALLTAPCCCCCCRPLCKTAGSSSAGPLHYRRHLPIPHPSLPGDSVWNMAYHKVLQAVRDNHTQFASNCRSLGRFSAIRVVLKMFVRT